MKAVLEILGLFVEKRIVGKFDKTLLPATLAGDQGRLVTRPRNHLSLTVDTITTSDTVNRILKTFSNMVKTLLNMAKDILAYGQKQSQNILEHNPSLTKLSQSHLQ